MSEEREQAEPVGYFVNDESDDQWHQVDYEQRNGADTYPLYLHPPAAAPQQAEPAAQIGWADEFGNLFPMGAWKPAKRTHHDSHKTAWRAVYLHPARADAEVRTEKCGYSTFADQVCNKCGRIHGYSHPPAAEVQRLRAAALALLNELDAGRHGAPEFNNLRNALRALEGGER